VPDAQVSLRAADRAGAMVNILLVTGSPSCASTLLTDLQGSEGWEVRVAEGSAGFVEVFATHPAQLVAVDLDSVGAGAAGVLSALAEHHPRTVRIGLTADRSAPAVARGAALAHRVLSVPTDGELLRAAITDALRAHRVPDGDRIAALVGGTKALPSAPAIWVRLNAALSEQDAGVPEVAAIVAEDPGMTAKLLQVVNSAYFGLGRTVTTARDAVALLGCESVRALVLSFEAFSVDRTSVPGLPIDAVRRHGLACATLTRSLLPKGRAADTAFVGALLQDVGIWVLARGCPTETAANLREARHAGRPLHEVELEALGVTHAEIGAHLLALWGLPQAVIDAVAGSHDPVEPLPETLGPADAVRIAHLLVQRDQPDAQDPTETADSSTVIPEAAASLLA
jgi:HD-like signal output (HDOD) protein